MANLLTGSRILCALALLACPAFSGRFYLLYILGGITDVLDGMAARCLNAETELGARLDTAADISEKNAKNLTGMNIWAIGGSGDGTCSKYHAKLFVEAINAAREKYDPDSTNVAQYSFFPGGHSCAYLGGTARKADEGVSITYAAQVLDFMFSSSRAADRTEEAG